MVPNYDDFLIKRFKQPDEVRTFQKGYFEIVKVGSMTIGRASYEPGWRWSNHVGPAKGAAACEVEHIGLVISGSAACQMNGGRHYEMKAGDLFHIGPGHDSWVVGNQPYVRSISSEQSITPGPRTANGALGLLAASTYLVQSSVTLDALSAGVLHEGKMERVLAPRETIDAGGLGAALGRPPFR